MKFISKFNFNVLMVSMLFTAGPVFAAESNESSNDCLNAVSGALETQKQLNKQSFEIADDILTGTTDELFDLDCINNISLSGGIRIFGPGDLLNRLKKATCDKINELTGQANQRLQSKLDFPFGLGGVEGSGSSQRRTTVSPTIRNESYDLNGDIDVPVSNGSDNPSVNFEGIFQ